MLEILHVILSYLFDSFLSPSVTSPPAYCVMDVKPLFKDALLRTMNQKYSLPMPEPSTLFPWLCSVDGFHSSAIDHSNFLLLIRSSALENSIGLSGILRNSIEYSTLLAPLERCVNTSDLVGKIVDYLDLSDPIFVNTIVEDAKEVGYFPMFKDLSDENLNIRSFNIQPFKVLQLSDVVVYCFNTNHGALCKCKLVSRLVRLAQLYFWKNVLENITDESIVQEGHETIRSTYILKDAPEVLTDPYYQNLVSLSVCSEESLKTVPGQLMNEYLLRTLVNWEVNYSMKEKFEIWKISSNHLILNGIWLGNEGDYFLWKMLNRGEDVPREANPLSHSTLPQYCSVHNSILYSNQGELVNKLQADWRLFVEVHGTSGLPLEATLRETMDVINESIEKPSADRSIFLSFPASGAIAGLGSLSILDLILIINVLRILYFKNDTFFPTLVYCAEGYTETSLLMVIYLVYATGSTVQQAIFDLYIKYGRPFYLFNNDYLLLKELEPLLLKFSPTNTSQTLDYLDSSNETRTIIGEVLLLKPKDTSVGWLSEFMLFNISGSLLPSRILPNMYLGSLTHGNSLDLLKSLNIDTIVSVGEILDWLKFLDDTSYVIESFGKSGSCSLVKVDAVNFPKFVLLVNDFKDDGVDYMSLELLQDVFEFFKMYTATDINSIVNLDLGCKTLVHCKVGVSRSATVVIAYMMNFLKMELEKAYLFVRVRRLNIIIQPNLKLIYSLFQLQDALNLKKASVSERYKFRKDSESSLSCDSETSSDYSQVPSQIFESRKREISNASSLQTSLTAESEPEKLLIGLRQVEWAIFCRQIDELNHFY